MEYWEQLYYFTKTSPAQLLNQNTWLKKKPNSKPKNPTILYGTVILIHELNTKAADMTQQLSWILWENVAFLAWNTN